jgi:hypothetical protein
VAGTPTLVASVLTLTHGTARCTVAHRPGAGSHARSRIMLALPSGAHVGALAVLHVAIEALTAGPCFHNAAHAS